MSGDKGTPRIDLLTDVQHSSIRPKKNCYVALKWEI